MDRYFEKGLIVRIGAAEIDWKGDDSLARLAEKAQEGRHAAFERTFAAGDRRRLEYYGHPIRRDGPITMAWARLDLDTWGEDVAGYRLYMVNHEVGHLLGVPHKRCGAQGQPAPVMLQQTISLDGCEPQGWPTGEEISWLRTRRGLDG